MIFRLAVTFGGCVCFLTACGTVSTRTSLKTELSDDFPPVYPATYVDTGLITAPCRSSFSGSAGKKAGACFCGLLDLPISLATDTLLLPYDLVVSASTD
jgi:uncharacterized protein YceK